MKKKLLPIGTVLVTLTCGLVVADYFTLFGSREKIDYVLHEVRIRPVNRLDKSPIEGTHASCFQQGNRNACSQRDSGKPGIVSLMVPGTRISRKSLLFERDRRYPGSQDPKIHIMLIHLDYQNQVKSIEVDELFNKPGQIHTVMMQAREPVPANEGDGQQP